MSFIKNIIFLYKSETKFKVIFIFIKQKLSKFLFKKKIKLAKKNNKNFLKNYNISNDYFSMNAFNFLQSLKKIKIFKNYLEIGSYEGNSALFVARNFTDVTIHCVDTWLGSKEHENENFNYVEKNFLLNTQKFKNIQSFKLSSDNFFSQYQNYKYDCIYVDGDHYCDQVYKDCINAFNSLRPGGILIFDDYTWKYFDKIKENPCYAINKFIKLYENKIIIDQVTNSQIFLIKI